MLSRTFSTVRRRLATTDTTGGVAVAFYAAVTLYAGWIVLGASQYRPETRLFPTLVGSAALVLVAVRVVGPRVAATVGVDTAVVGDRFDGRRADGTGQGGGVDATDADATDATNVGGATDADTGETTDADTGDATDVGGTTATVEPRHGVVLFGWLAALLALFALAGPLVAIAGVTAGYVAVHRGSPRAAIGLAAAVAVGVYLLFVVVLELPSYDPVLLGFGLGFGPDFDIGLPGGGS